MLSRPKKSDDWHATKHAKQMISDQEMVYLFIQNAHAAIRAKFRVVEKLPDTLEEAIDIMEGFAVIIEEETEDLVKMKSQYQI